MPTVNVYLNFNGQCEAAFNLYKSAFGKEFGYMGKFKDMPQDPDAPLSETDLERVMHVTLPISQETVLMGSDTTLQSGQEVTFGNNFAVSINVGSQEEADHLFNALSEGGQVLMPMSHTFWGAYFGMFTDKFNVPWMINFDLPTA